jgi:hypothetical protein
MLDERTIDPSVASSLVRSRLGASLHLRMLSKRWRQLTIKARQFWRRTGRSFLLPGALFLAVVAAFGLVLALCFSDWPARGQFGDAFGVLSAVFSAAAFGAVAYTLVLQQRQIAEMRSSFALEHQPLLSLQPKDFVLERPRWFTSPGRDGPEILSRFRADWTVANVSQYPAVAAVLDARLLIPGDGGKESSIQSVGSHMPLLAPGATDSPDTLFVPRDSYDAFHGAICKRTAAALPRVVISVAYRNLIGAGFIIRDEYYVLPGPNSDADLKKWQSAILSLGRTHRGDSRTPREWNRPHGSLDALQQSLVSLLGEPEERSLELERIPGRFGVRTVPLAEYEEFVRLAGTPRLVFAGTPCSAQAKDA